MNTPEVGPIMKGIVVEIKQNNIGTYDGIIETTNKNKYHFFNNANNLNIGSYSNFNMATSNLDNIDFEAINVVPF